MEVKKKAKDPLRHRNSVRQQLVEAQVMVSEKERMKNMSDFMLSSELDNLMEVSVPPPPPPRDDDDEDSDDMLSDGVGVPAEPRDVAEDSDDMLSEGLGDVMVGGVDDDDDDDDEMELSDDLGVAHTHPTTSRATMPRVFSNGRIDALARDDSHKVKNLVSNNQKLKRMHRALNPAQKRQLGLRDNSVPLDGRTKKAKTLKAKGRAGQIIVDENTRRLHRTGGGSSASSGGTIRLIARPKKRGKEPGDLPNQDVIDRGRREAAALRKTNMVEVRFAPPGNLMSNGLDNIPLEARKAMEDGVGESGDQKRLERQIRRLDYINNNKNQSRGKLEATTALEKERREEIDEVDKMRSQFQHTGHYNIMREILTRPAHEDINNASIENGGVPDLVVDLIERSFQRVELNTRRREEERDMREWRTATLDGHKCVNGSECEIRRLALPAGKEETAVGLMYMTADQWAAFDMSRGKELPDVPGPCLLCLRASMQIIYFAMESSHLSAASDYLEQRVCNYVNKPGEYMFQYTLTNPEKGIPHPIVLHCYDYYECELDQDGYVRIYQTGLPSIDIEEVLDAMPLDESFVDPSGITETRSMAENEPHTLSSDEHVRRADVANRKTMRERHEKDWKQKRDLLKKRLVNKVHGMGGVGIWQKGIGN